MPGKWWVGGSILSILFGSLAQAQVHPSPPVRAMIPDSACAVKISGECALKADHRTFDIIFDSGAAAVMVLGGPQENEAESPVVVRLKLSEQLDTGLSKGEITEEEAATVRSDLARLEGAKYTVPELDKLKSDLGFSKESSIEKEDLSDLLSTHLQLTLSLRPSTAKYFSALMGVRKTGSVPVKSPRVAADAPSTPNHN